MKKLFTIALVLMLSLTVVGSVFAGSGIKKFNSAVLQYGSTGWGGWSCPSTHPYIVSGKVKKSTGGKPDFPIGETHKWKPGAVTDGGVAYPSTPFGYTYTPPEEGFIVRNGETGQNLIITLTCQEPYEVCDETVRWPNEVEFSEWSAFVWDAGRGLYVSTRIKTVTKIWGDSVNQKYVCKTVEVEYPEEQTRGPDEVIVGASFGCSSPDEDGIIWQLQGGVTINPGGDATLTLDGVDYTSSQGFHLPFGSYSWSAVAAEGHTIAGDSSGSFKLTDSNCNDPSDPPEEHPATGPESALAVPVAAGVSGLALLAMGIRLYSKRRED